MVDEIRVLYMGNKSHILVPKHSERKGYIPFEERFIPQSVGDRALDFANSKLSISEMIGKYKALGEHCFSSAGGFSENQAQTIVMRLSDTLHEISGGGLFAIEILRLDALDREIAMRGKKDAVAQEYADILSSIEELGRFQERFRLALSDLSLVQKRDSGHAGNAQILLHIFDTMPDLAAKRCGMAGYMAADVDEEGHFRGEMLDPDYTNMMHAAFHPDCSRSLLRNDVRDEKTVCEYYVLSCGCELAMLDLGKALQHSLSFTRCATCGRFFFAFDRRRRYCGNSECNTGRARANKYRKQNQEDPVLEKALCYKNVMASRYRRTIQRENPYTPQKESPRSVSHLEYEQWTRTFHQELNRYKDAKGGAFLLDTEDEDVVIKEAGTVFLNAIRPNDYKPDSPHKKRK